MNQTEKQGWRKSQIMNDLFTWLSASRKGINLVYSSILELFEELNAADHHEWGDGETLNDR